MPGGGPGEPGEGTGLSVRGLQAAVSEVATWGEIKSHHQNGGRRTRRPQLWHAELGGDT